MKDRIELLLNVQNLTPSQFADEIGVQRSSISHVLSERNKPSLEFISKTLARFPEVRTDWLIFGTGSMMNMDSDSSVAESKQTFQETPDLFSNLGGAPAINFTSTIDESSKHIPQEDREMQKSAQSIIHEALSMPSQPNDDRQNISQMEAVDQDSRSVPHPAQINDNIHNEENPILRNERSSAWKSEMANKAEEAKEKTIQRSDNKRVIEKIILFYSDHSFEEFKPNL